jgi:hypothetical protein
MRDPRALASLGNLQSYRAWEEESYRRSGFLLLIMSVPVVLAPLFIVTTHLATTFFRHYVADARASAVLIAVALPIYLGVAGGLMVLAIVRLRAWKRAHAWTPPTPGRSWRRGLPH